MAPVPESTNHFSGIFVFHRESKVIHVDDTIMIGSHPGILLKLAGYTILYKRLININNIMNRFRHGSMSFHPSIKGPGLLPTPEAPYQFKEFIEGVIRDWDFDTICAAHMGIPSLLSSSLSFLFFFLLSPVFIPHAFVLPVLFLAPL